MPPFVPTVYLAGPDHGAILAALAPALPTELPSRVLDGDAEHASPADWAAIVTGAPVMAVAEWAGEDPGRPRVSVGRGADQGLSITLPKDAAPRSAAAALELLAGAGPWETATFPSYATLWRDEFDTRTPSLADGHPPHGWAVALRGTGHDRLVSRRWLTQDDLWTVHRDEATDTTLVEFHDPTLPPLEALSAARAAHQRFGRTDEGGWIPLQPVQEDDLSGLYEADTRSFKVIVPPGRDVPQRELLAACQARYLRRDSAESIDRLAYVFLDARAAPSLREELALRDIECWVIDDSGDERQL